jgi:hypothetical protein
MSTKQITAPCASRAEHAQLISAALVKGVEAAVEAGQRLAIAQYELPRPDFLAMLAEDLHMTEGTASKLKAIASFSALVELSKWKVLPADWTTLYALTKVPPALLQSAIDDGRVYPGMTGKDVKALMPPPPEPEQRDDDLPPSDDDEAEPEETAEPTDKHERETIAVEVKHLASKLVELDRDTARALHKLLWEDVHGWQHQLECALARELGLEIEGNDLPSEPSAGNGTDPDASAAIGKAQFAEDADRWIDGDPA